MPELSIINIGIATAAVLLGVVARYYRGWFPSPAPSRTPQRLSIDVSGDFAAACFARRARCPPPLRSVAHTPETMSRRRIPDDPWSSTTADLEATAWFARDDLDIPLDELEADDVVEVEIVAANRSVVRGSFNATADVDADSVRFLVDC